MHVVDLIRKKARRRSVDRCGDSSAGRRRSDKFHSGVSACGVAYGRLLAGAQRPGTA